MGDVGNIVAALEGSSTQGDTNRANKKMSQQANVMNMILSMYSKGKDFGDIDPLFLSRLGIPKGLLTRGGVIMPEYGADQERSTFNQAQRVSAAIAAENGTPEAQVEVLKALLEKYGPDFTNDEQFVSDLTSGRLTQKELGYAQPAQEARIGLAQGRKVAGLESLQAILNNIDTIQARKGYAGDSSGKRQLEFNARREIGTRGADDLNMAKLQNAMENQDILMKGGQRQLANLGLGDRMYRAAIARNQLPGEALVQGFNRVTAPFSMFNQNPTQFRNYEAGPLAQPGASFLQALGQVGGSGGTALTNYFLKNGMKGFGAGGVPVAGSNADYRSMGGNLSNGYTGYNIPDYDWTGGAGAALDSGLYSAGDFGL